MEQDGSSELRKRRTIDKIIYQIPCRPRNSKAEHISTTSDSFIACQCSSLGCSQIRTHTVSMYDLVSIEYFLFDSKTSCPGWSNADIMRYDLVVGHLTREILWQIRREPSHDLWASQLRQVSLAMLQTYILLNAHVHLFFPNRA